MHRQLPRPASPFTLNSHIQIRNGRRAFQYGLPHESLRWKLARSEPILVLGLEVGLALTIF